MVPGAGDGAVLDDRHLLGIGLELVEVRPAVEGDTGVLGHGGVDQSRAVLDVRLLGHAVELVVALVAAERAWEERLLGLFDG